MLLCDGAVLCGFLCRIVIGQAMKVIWNNSLVNRPSPALLEAVPLPLEGLPKLPPTKPGLQVSEPLVERAPTNLQGSAQAASHQARPPGE